MNCEFCQSPVHIWFDCPKKPSGWKPARLAAKSTAAGKDRLRRTSTRELHPLGPAMMLYSPPEGGDAGSKERALEAGTQALPVDTNSGPTSAGSIPVSSTIEGLSGQSKSVPGKGLQAEGVQIPNGPPKFDRKAWQREYMREYMRKRRAAK